MTAPDKDSGERQLVEAAREDPGRFAELYDLYFSRVYAFALSRTRNRAEAQDITSAVFEQALTHIQTFEWRGVPFISWLFRIAANAVSDRAQKLAREEKFLQQMKAEEAAISDELYQQAYLFDLVRDLPTDQRRVLELRFVEQKNVREIATDLGRSEGAVKQLQYRALNNLRARLGERNG